MHPPVCAIIVSFHPTQSMVENMRDLQKQVQDLIVVDNGSEAREVSWLLEGGSSAGFHVLQNESNLGIAYALNQGVRWAKSRSYDWIILFDQDSRITEGFINQMFRAWSSHADPARVASIHPRYVDPVTGIEPRVFRAADGGPITSMTSGALMPSWIFDKIGFFPEEYFIDQVDTEYGFRIRAAGFLSADSREAVLLHSAGHPKRIRFLGFSFEPTHHSPARRYYFTRNRVVTYRKYFLIFPRWVLHAMYIASRENLKCFLAEPHRLRKLRNLLLGFWDGVTGRMGKREGI